MSDNKHPNFTQWIDSTEGKNANDITTLSGQKFLTNRLFLAFDAGRNCIWDQFQESKDTIKQLQEENSQIKAAAITQNNIATDRLNELYEENQRLKEALKDCIDILKHPEVPDTPERLENARKLIEP